MRQLMLKFENISGGGPYQPLLPPQYQFASNAPSNLSRPEQPELSTGNLELYQARKKSADNPSCIKPGTVSSPEQTMPGRRLRYPSCNKPGSSVLSNTEQTMPGKRNDDTCGCSCSTGVTLTVVVVIY
ncbi:hypothetical protein DPMN_087061 [Dreissena polymorpha]|uniref:Uncharacterized protein n=1 Tax=Dreissena polymorpha TaxID=45954 RepID=A0A9D4QV90_DREPO|nr:hypothetical protein DPMN_087061 [Dreissena polymorpha]